MENSLKISIISGQRSIIDDLSGNIKESIDNVLIKEFESDIEFLKAFSVQKTDIIISEKISSITGWNFFIDEIFKIDRDAFVIFITDNGDKELIAQMLISGVYDVISPGSFYGLQILLLGIIKEIEDKEYLRYLSREKYFTDNIVDQSKSMISIINRKYIYEKVNATFCNEQNTMTDSIVGKSLADVWGSEIFERNIKNNIDLCFNGDTIKYEASFNTPQSGRRYFDVIFRPIPGESGEINHLYAETVDISDQKLSEKNAVEMEEELNRLETNLPIGLLRCHLNGTIIHANKTFLKIMQCPDEASLIGQNLNKLYTEEGLFEMHLKQLNDSKIKTFGRVQLKTSGGNEIVCRTNGFIVENESGIPSYIDFAFEDSTRELLLENRLLQAQKLETIGAFAGGIAHDFNNILATISGYSEMLKDDLPKASASSEKVGKILSAVSKAQSLTNQILTFSRQVEQEKISISVYKVLKETIGFAKSGIPSNISIKEDIKKVDANVDADPTQLFRVFLNLMTNAIQSMEETGGILSVDLAIIDGKLAKRDLNKDIVADEYVLITFKDTGIGMDTSLMQRIFEPFYTTREVGKGTGLGLSVVHGIVAEMEGEILVSSKKQKGSVFKVYIPVSKEYNNLSENHQERKKILFITGNKYESHILSLALESSGYELIYASDPEHLVRVMSDTDEKPDIIIFMGDSEKIKKDDMIGLFNKERIKTPCILITESNQDFYEEKIVNSGIILQHLIKPVSLKEIRNAIQQFLI